MRSADLHCKYCIIITLIAITIIIMYSLGQPETLKV